MRVGDFVVPRVHHSDLFAGKLCIVRSASGDGWLKLQRISHWGRAAPLADCHCDYVTAVDSRSFPDDQLALAMAYMLAGDGA